VLTLLVVDNESINDLIPLQLGVDLREIASVEDYIKNEDWTPLLNREPVA
jgi:hypothetical protein